MRTAAEREAGIPPVGGADRGTATVRIDPARITSVRIQYAPARDGAPDAGEVIWTWVPYEENDGRGKDRPVLVIGRASADRVYAVRMTSKPHDGDRDYLSIGAGDWDSQGRESWVDIEQLYSVHEQGLRREAAVLDRRRYDRVSAALTRRYGWSAAG
nr:type II toxin-antitoxin system PemK/MazF family toxin [Microbacterium oxydans]